MPIRLDYRRPSNPDPVSPDINIETAGDERRPDNMTRMVRGLDSRSWGSRTGAPVSRRAEGAAAVDELRASGAQVLMVGDGLNDTAALAAAHVSVSPASALGAARVASDIVLMGNDLAPVAEALTIAQSARRRIKENFAISVLYNIVAVPFAIAGLQPRR